MRRASDARAMRVQDRRAGVHAACMRSGTWKDRWLNCISSGSACTQEQDIVCRAGIDGMVENDRTCEACSGEAVV